MVERVESSSRTLLRRPVRNFTKFSRTQNSRGSGIDEDETAPRIDDVIASTVPDLRPSIVDLCSGIRDVPRVRLHAYRLQDDPKGCSPYSF